MTFQSWRGTVGLIKPTLQPGSLEELIRILPEGIGVIPLFSINFSKGTLAEFEDAYKRYDEPVSSLAQAGVDLIHPEGAPPFMVQGYKKESTIIRAWEEQYNIPIFTSGTNHVAALRALGVKRFVGVSYFTGKINAIFSSYFKEAGFEVLDMQGIDVPFDRVGQLSAHEVYAYIKKVYLKHKRKAQGIYLLGSQWRILDIIPLLEQDLRVPVVHPVPARCWEIQKRLYVHEPVERYGKLLFEMPGLPGS